MIDFSTSRAPHLGSLPPKRSSTEGHLNGYKKTKKLKALEASRAHLAGTIGDCQTRCPAPEGKREASGHESGSGQTFGLEGIAEESAVYWAFRETEVAQGGNRPDGRRLQRGRFSPDFRAKRPR
jgi:hypothetical protein